MNVATCGVALCAEQVLALVEEMQVNEFCGLTAESEFASNHLPEGETDEFYRGMASGLILAAGLVFEGDEELVSMLRCLAAKCGAAMQA